MIGVALPDLWRSFKRSSPPPTPRRHRRPPARRVLGRDSRRSRTPTKNATGDFAFFADAHRELLVHAAVALLLGLGRTQRALASSVGSMPTTQFPQNTSIKLAQRWLAPASWRRRRPAPPRRARGPARNRTPRPSREGRAERRVGARAGVQVIQAELHEVAERLGQLLAACCMRRARARERRRIVGEFPPLRAHRGVALMVASLDHVEDLLYAPISRGCGRMHERGH